jgi:plasmid stabilization system protein ParE
MAEAVRYYEQSRAGLGIEFAERVEEAIDKLLAFPESYRIVTDGIRRCRLKRFPYSLLYRIDQDKVTILAVHHASRKPGFGLDRT